MENKKILLLNPRAYNLNTSIPLSLAYLGAQLVNNGYLVKVIDASASNNPLTNIDIIKKINDFQPDVICITILTLFAKEAYELIHCINRSNDDLSSDHRLIIAGGAHATILPTEVLQKGADIVIRGEGEITLVELLKAYFNGISLDTVEGISFSSSNGVIHTANRKYIEDLDLLPPPAKNIFDPQWYSNTNKPTNESFGTIITSRGCPGKCTFCSRAVFSNKMRYNSPDYIIDQMVSLHNTYGITRFYIVDDNFMTNKIRLSRICQLINEKLPSITWACTSRIDSVNPDALKMIKDSGCTTITYGLESGCDKTLKAINKHLTVQKIISTVKMTYYSGIDVCANWIMGYPSESEGDVEETINLIELLNPYITMHNASFLVPFPGTDIYEQYKYLESVKDYWLICNFEKSTWRGFKNKYVASPDTTSNYWYPMEKNVFSANIRLSDILNRFIEEKHEKLSRGYQTRFYNGIEIFFDSGWYPTEKWGEREVNWTNGSGVIKINQMVSTLTFKYLSIWPFNDTNLKILVNDNVVFSEKNETINSWVDISIELKEYPHPFLIKIESDNFIPKSVNLNDDSRTLGIAVSEIKTE